MYIYMNNMYIYIYIHLFGARTLHGFPEKKCGPNFRDEKSAANFPVEPAMVREAGEAVGGVSVTAGSRCCCCCCGKNGVIFDYFL